MVTSGRKLVGSFIQTDDLRAMGLGVAKGLIYATSFDWNLNDDTRAFASRFLPRAKVMPNQNMASAYSAITHYLKAIAAVGSKDADQIMAQMRATPINDVFARNGTLRIDGRMSHGMYVIAGEGPGGLRQRMGHGQATQIHRRRRRGPSARRRRMQASQVTPEPQRRPCAGFLQAPPGRAQG